MKKPKNVNPPASTIRQEVEVMLLYGCCRHDIAAKLGLPLPAVEGHLASIKKSWQERPDWSEMTDAELKKIIKAGGKKR